MPLPARPVAFPLFSIVDGKCACGNESCSRVGKHPRVAWGELAFGDAVPDREPYAGIGIKTGAEPKGSGCIVVDLDSEAACDAWEAMGGDWETYTVETPRGWHLYFEHPGLKVGNSAGALGKGIDIRGDGGFVVGPGSPHASGKTYTVANDTALAAVPGFLLSWLASRPVPAEAQAYPGDVEGDKLAYHRRLFTEHCRTAPACVAGAGGDDALWKVVQYGAWDLSMPGQDVLELVTEHFDPRCSPSWGAELEAKVLHKVRCAKEQSTRPANPPWPEDIAPKVKEEFTLNDSPIANSELGEEWGGWDQPIPEPVYLLEGLIPQGKVCTFFAEGGSVKSWAAFLLAICVTTGEPWLGRTVQQGKALILDYEDGKQEFQRRMRILRGGKLESLPELGYKYQGPELNKPDLWRALLRLELMLVVIDTLGSGMPGDADENDKRYSDAVKMAGVFTGQGCTVVIVAHANKSGGLRGSSAIRDQSDCVFKFEPVSETDSTKRMRMVCDKPGPQKRPTPVNLELSDSGLKTFDDAAASVARNDRSQSGVEAAVMLALLDGPKTVKRLRLHLKPIKASTVSEAVGVLVEEGKLRSLGKQTGYLRDDEEARRARVLTTAKTFVGSTAGLAAEAAVPHDFVLSMIGHGKGLLYRVEGKPEFGFLGSDRSGG